MPDEGLNLMVGFDTGDRLGPSVSVSGEFGVASKLFEQLNATVTERRDLSPVLIIIRVKSDKELFPFEPGQFSVLGLPPDAPRVSLAEDEEPLSEKELGRMIRRAYSIASSSKQGEYVEFYLSLVHSGGLTPRLFSLQPGDRVWLGPKATGMFTLEHVPGDVSLLLVSTGTGLAPYLSMLRTDLMEQKDRPRIVVAHGARYSWDLGYRGELERMIRRHPRLVYIPSITRPSEDPDWAGEVGYLQDQIADGRIEERGGIDLAPDLCHVFLCGNPAMIDRTLTLLMARGYSQWSKDNPEGQIHLEKYWE